MVLYSLTAVAICDRCGHRGSTVPLCVDSPRCPEILESLGTAEQASAYTANSDASPWEHVCDPCASQLAKGAASGNLSDALSLLSECSLESVYAPVTGRPREQRR